MTNELERQIIEIIATDRISIPIKSIGGKLDRTKPKLAKAVDLEAYDGDFAGDRVYARVEEDETMKARGMRNGIEKFKAEYPRHGDVLEGYIAEERLVRETNLYFGVNTGCRLTAEDYMGVMRSLGFTDRVAADLYPNLMEISNKLSRKRQEERSILIG
ncbi:MAG: hypothetical protein ABIH72_00885 [archaeon]